MAIGFSSSIRQHVSHPACRVSHQSERVRELLNRFPHDLEDQIDAQVNDKTGDDHRTVHGHGRSSLWPSNKSLESPPLLRLLGS